MSLAEQTTQNLGELSNDNSEVTKPTEGRWNYTPQNLTGRTNGLSLSNLGGTAEQTPQFNK